MRGRALAFVVLLLLSTAAEAQMTWQPTPPPSITAENEAWYRAGAAIEWNGDLYYPAGVPQAFNRYQMARAGSYRGIPLYTDTTLEPNSIVFVPIAGGRLQPYERPRTGTLAGSAGSRMSAFPTVPSSEGVLTTTPEGYVAQAPAPPTFARGYDAGSVREPISPAVPVIAGTEGAVATSGVARAASRPTATSGRTLTVTNAASTAARPKGLNGVWLDYDGRRWVSAGPAVDLTRDFTRVGEYRGAAVYRRNGDSATIYVPMIGTLLTPFKVEERSR